MDYYTVKYRPDMSLNRKGDFLCIDDNIRIKLDSIISYHLIIESKDLVINCIQGPRYNIKTGDQNTTMKLIQTLDCMLLPDTMLVNPKID